MNAQAASTFISINSRHLGPTGRQSELRWKGEHEVLVLIQLYTPGILITASRCVCPRCNSSHSVRSLKRTYLSKAGHLPTYLPASLSLLPQIHLSIYVQSEVSIIKTFKTIKHPLHNSCYTLATPSNEVKKLLIQEKWGWL